MTLDNDSKALLAWRLEIGAPYFENMTPEEARAAMAAGRKAANITPPAVGQVRDIQADVAGRKIDLRLYSPDALDSTQSASQPCMIFFHGGGFVVGDLNSHDVLCRNLTIASGVTIVAVDYRLAPEHKFPAALEDAQDAINWIVENAAQLGLDTERMAIGGDSAGGNLATVMCHLSRDGRIPAKFQLQLLAYPWVDLTMAQTSYGISAEGLPVTFEAMSWFRELYLNTDAEQVDWRGSPLMAPNMKGLASAYILTAGYDPLCDEGQAYARRLEQGGVSVQTRHYPGQIHGFLTMGAQLPTAAEATKELGQVLKTALNA
jgi:acetyl esterase